MFVRKREKTQPRGQAPPGDVVAYKLPLHLLPRAPPPRRSRWQADARCAQCALAADATSLSLQVSWHFVAFPEPAPHRSLLPGAASRPLSIMIQDLPLAPQELGSLRFLSHRSLCLYVDNACSSHRSQRHEVQGEASSWRPRGGKSSS